MQKERSFFRQMLVYSACLILFSLALACGGVYRVLRRLLRPLNTLVGVTRMVGAGDLGHRAPVDSVDELGQLAAAFNSMVERLGETTVSKDYVDNILRSMGEALIVTDRGGRVRRVNPRTEELLGYREAELAGRPALSLVAEGEAPAATAGIERSYRARDGRLIPIWLSSARLLGAAGTADGQVWLAQDMSELKRTQAELVRTRDAAEQANRAKSVFPGQHEPRTAYPLERRHRLQPDAAGGLHRPPTGRGARRPGEAKEQYLQLLLEKEKEDEQNKKDQGDKDDKGDPQQSGGGNDPNDPNKDKGDSSGDRPFKGYWGSR